MFSITSILFALTGCAIIFLFQQRMSHLGKLERSHFPELDDHEFTELRQLLKTAYERTLYMGALFLPLAYASRTGGSRMSQLFFLLLIAMMLIANIFPRNRVMKMLDERGVTMKTLRQRGINL